MMRLPRVVSLTILLLAVCGCLSVGDVSRMVDEARVRVRLGVMSNTEVGWITETAALKRALTFYRDAGVDAVVIAGGVTRNGYKNQFEVLDKVWAQVFGARTVPLIIEEGRHRVKDFEFQVSFRRSYGRNDLLTFHGDGKRSLTDELCFYPRKNLSVYAGSMSGVDVADGSDGRSELAHRAKGAAQGLLVSVYDDLIRMRRFDLVNGEEVAEPWEIVPSGEVADAFPPAPEFWNDTSARLTTGYEAQSGERMYTLTWPNVLKRFTGERARHFEVKIRRADASREVLATRTVISSGFYLAEGRDLAAVKTVFREQELRALAEPSQMVFFEIVPVGMFGAHGRSLMTETLKLR